MKTVNYKSCQSIGPLSNNVDILTVGVNGTKSLLNGRLSFDDIETIKNDFEKIYDENIYYILVSFNGKNISKYIF